jgi:hypothetical protein
MRQNDNIENRGCCSPAIPPAHSRTQRHSQAQPTKRRKLEIAAERLSQCRMLVHTEGICQCY